MNEQTIEFNAACPDCGVSSTWTAEQRGLYPDVLSRITRIEHGMKS